MKILIALLMVMAVPACALPVRSVGCAATAEAAVKLMLANVVGADVAEGFRVESVRFDSVRGKTWVVLASCAEPSRPRVAIVVGAEEPIATVVKKTLLIHNGDHVLVESDTGSSRIELTGWAEGAGGEGDAMLVRLNAMRGDGTSTKMRCRVVKAGVVEVVQ